MTINFQSPGQTNYYAILPQNPQSAIRWVTAEEFPEHVVEQTSRPCCRMFMYADAGCWANRGNHREFFVYRAVDGVARMALCRYDPSYEWTDHDRRRIQDDVLRNLLIRCQASIIRIFSVPLSEFYGNPPETGDQIFFLLGDLHLPVANRSSCHYTPPGWIGSRYSDVEQLWHNANLTSDLVAATSIPGIISAYASRDIPLPNSPGARVVLNRDGILAGGARELLDRAGANETDEWLSQYYPADIFHSGSSDNAAQQLGNLLRCLERWCIDMPNNQVHFIQLGDFYEFWIGLTRLFRKDQESRLGNRAGRVLLGIQDDCIDNTEGLNFLGTTPDRSPGRNSANQARTLIEEWLRRADVSSRVEVQEVEGDRVVSVSFVSLTSRLFDDAQSNLSKTFLVGNHDSYLSAVTAPGQSPLWAIQDVSGCSDTSPAQWPASQRENRIRVPRFETAFDGSGLHLEHGHSWDPHNQDGATSGWEVTQGAFVAPSLRSAQNILYSQRETGPHTIFGDSDRQKALEEAVRWHSQTGAGQNMVLFGMAHTHSPFLTKIHYHHES